ncbi:MAG: hypothetical protein ACLVH9_05335 [Fusobacterium sp.]|uniref:hypothetical protein n=1 Tax=Fusobacterium sp. TaxID=68766 RepID=UPI00399B076A
MDKKNSNFDIYKQNLELYKKFIKKKKELGLTFELMQEKTKIPQSTISSAVYRLKEGKSVTTKTLNMLNEVLGETIFFTL